MHHCTRCLPSKSREKNNNKKKQQSPCTVARFQSTADHAYLQRRPSSSRSRYRISIAIFSLEKFFCSLFDWSVDLWIFKMKPCFRSYCYLFFQSLPHDQPLFRLEQQRQFRRDVGYWHIPFGLAESTSDLSHFQQRDFVISFAAYTDTASALNDPPGFGN